jgi:hypothetical protein
VAALILSNSVGTFLMTDPIKFGDSAKPSWVFALIFFGRLFQFDEFGKDLAAPRGERVATTALKSTLLPFGGSLRDALVNRATVRTNDNIGLFHAISMIRRRRQSS